MSKDPVSKLRLYIVIMFIPIFICLLCIVSELHIIRNTIANINTADVTSTGSSSNDVVTEHTSYDTSITEWNITTDSGETFKFHTPVGYYSLSDQYLSNLKSYYNIESDILSESMIVIGNNTSPYQSENVINADCLSDISKILAQMYGEDYDEETMAKSEAYVYMTTGSLPEEVPDNYTIEEAATYVVDGIEFVAYEVNYDTTYMSEGTDVDEDGNTVEPETTVVHTQNISCYSKTEDSIEVVVFMQNFNKEEALSLLREFLGAEE